MNNEVEPNLKWYIGYKMHVIFQNLKFDYFTT